MWQALSKIALGMQKAIRHHTVRHTSEEWVPPCLLRWDTTVALSEATRTLLLEEFEKSVLLEAQSQVLKIYMKSCLCDQPHATDSQVFQMCSPTLYRRIGEQQQIVFLCMERITYQHILWVFPPNQMTKSNF